jgi:hypothetical protein
MLDKATLIKPPHSVLPVQIHRDVEFLGHCTAHFDADQLEFPRWPASHAPCWRTHAARLVRARNMLASADASIVLRAVCEFARTEADALEHSVDQWPRSSHSGGLILT